MREGLETGGIKLLDSSVGASCLGRNKSGILVMYGTVFNEHTP